MSCVDQLRDGRLWSNKATDRLSAAREAAIADRIRLQQWIGRDCPVASWPYGMPTAINPKVVVLGPSPGASPAAGDEVQPSYEPPTFGEHHPQLFYADRRSFFLKVRALCAGLLECAEGLEEADALALSGMMNLDVRRNGNAADVKTDAKLMQWVTETITQRLRPDYLICLGLKARIKDVLPLISSHFDSGRPMRSFRFDAQPKLKYQEWLLERSDKSQMRVVFWPQHPSRAPFSNGELWQASIVQYAQSLKDFR